jgi:DNA repair protein RadB
MVSIDRLPSGCQAVDALLGGGFETGIITQLYGEAGSGKTNITLQLSVQAVNRGYRVIYIDTEGFSVDRFSQIAGENAKEIASKIVIFEPLNLEQQRSAIKDAARIAGSDFGLVILDSATSLYRILLEAEDNRAVRRMLSSQIGDLQELARKHRIPVLITNQVYTDLETGAFKPLGGTSVEHTCKAILGLEKAGTEGRRRARVMKHRSRPDGEAAEFRITDKGVE